MTNALSDFLGAEVPPLTDHQVVCQNARPVGNATFLLRLPGGQEAMATLPGRYRNLIWLRRGGYCVATLPFPAREAASRAEELARSTASIAQVLSEVHIRQLAARGEWPPEFSEAVERLGARPGRGEGPGPEGEEQGEEDGPGNRVHVVIDESSSSEMYY